MERYCKKCDEVTERKLRSCGRLGECKVCAKNYRDANKDKMRKWAEENKEYLREYKKRRQVADGKRYREENLHKIYAKNAGRRALLKCEDADKELIEAVYLARVCAQMYTGQPVHVDHVVPLAKGGLHHEDNLQLLYAKDNLIKSDKLQG